ncbi:hypothetical protein BEN74_04870 [Acinetobacter sp. WCHAc010034]|nr:hypothetical protein BEN74_04870 [Acinetobacter sp. WCHAc010034]
MRILHDLLLNPEASIFCLFCKNKQPKLICRRQKSTTALRRLNTQKIEKKCDVIYEKITPCQNCIWRMVRREEHTKITVKFYLIFPVLFRLKC